MNSKRLLKIDKSSHLEPRKVLRAAFMVSWRKSPFLSPSVHLFAGGELSF